MQLITAIGASGWLVMLAALLTSLVALIARRQLLSLSHSQYELAALLKSAFNLSLIISLLVVVRVLAQAASAPPAIDRALELLLSVFMLWLLLAPTSYFIALLIPELSASLRITALVVFGLAGMLLAEVAVQSREVLVYFMLPAALVVLSAPWVLHRRYHDPPYIGIGIAMVLGIAAGLASQLPLPSLDGLLRPEFYALVILALALLMLQWASWPLLNRNTLPWQAVE